MINETKSWFFEKINKIEKIFGQAHQEKTKDTNKQNKK